MKWGPAFAVAEYHLAIIVHKEFSGLLLAVSMGILQYFIEATPDWIGATCLRAQYDVLHIPKIGIGLKL